MTPDEWWARWSAVWWAIGWRRLAERSNYNVGDALDLIATLLMRVRRLEDLQSQLTVAPWRGLW